MSRGRQPDVALLDISDCGVNMSMSICTVCCHYCNETLHIHQIGAPHLQSVHQGALASLNKLVSCFYNKYHVFV